MIQANELRIGNWLDFKGLWQAQVDLISDGMIQFKGNKGCFSPEIGINPIPLDESWLRRAGFTNNGYAFFSKQFDEFIWIGVQFKDYACLQLMEHPEVSDFTLPIKCIYVHQLQNLFFALTGQELEFTEEIYIARFVVKTRKP